MLGISESIVLGFVEGITEFLPVSSTGHLILTTHFLNIEETDFVKAFQIIIQSGAMLAVVIEYRNQFLKWLRPSNFKSLHYGEGQQIFALFLGFLPAGIVGFLFGNHIKAMLFNPMTVSVSLILGGFAILVFEKLFSTPVVGTAQSSRKSFQFPTPVQSLKIGIFQCLALIPGVSRSLATILGGRFNGLSKIDATIFSFYLAVPTLLVASLYDLYKNREVIFRSSEQSSLVALAIGFSVSFLVAWVCIRVFLNFVQKFSLAGFGWYRILLGIMTLFLL